MNSIRRRLTRDVFALSAILLAGSMTALYFAARGELVEQFDAALRAKALAIRATIGDSPGGNRIAPDLAASLLADSEAGPPEDYYEARDARGAVLVRSPSLGVADRLQAPVGDLAQPRFWNLQLPDGREGRAIGVRFTRPPDPGDRGAREASMEILLVFASSREDFDEELSALFGIAGACGALLLGATVWLVPRALQRGLAPLDRLAERAALIDADTLSDRFPAADLPQELAPICSRLNALLARLEASLVRERQFSADLAH